MSALYGLIRTGGPPIDAATLAPMGAALRALMPDGRNQWHDADAAIGFGAMRISPRDSIERQPLFGGGGTLVLASTGHLHERDRLGAALGLASHAWHGLADSALLMRAYECWGENCAERLGGSFALVVWDRTRRRLFAMRSAFGAPPLLYHHSQRSFAFATRPKALFALPWIDRQIDDAYLADYLVSIRGDPGHCLWRDVRALEPGQALTFDLRTPVIRRYWLLDALPEQRTRPPSDVAEELTELLDRVVADHRMSSARAAVLMSGGLDSTAVAAIAARQLRASGDDLLTFTEVPVAGTQGNLEADRYADESPFAEAMGCHHANLGVNLIRRDGFYLDDIVPMFEAAEFPFRNAANRIWWEACLRAAAAQGANVVLTGVGGNLTVSCAGEALLVQLLGRGDLLGAVYAARQQVRRGHRRSTGRALLGAAAALMPPVVNGPLMRWRMGLPLRPESRPWQRYSPIGTGLVEATRLLDRYREKGRSFDVPAVTPTRTRRLDALLKPDGPGAEVAIGHKQMYAIETRHPLCDQRIVEFCLSLPEAAFVPHGEPRGLLRQAMAGQVPDAILTNRKRGVQGSGWLARLHANRDRIEAELARFSHSPLIAHAIDLDRVKGLWQSLPPIGSEAGAVKLAYRAVFESALMTGRFLYWVETGD